MEFWAKSDCGNDLSDEVLLSDRSILFSKPETLAKFKMILAEILSSAFLAQTSTSTNRNGFRLLPPVNPFFASIKPFIIVF